MASRYAGRFTSTNDRLVAKDASFDGGRGNGISGAFLDARCCDAWPPPPPLAAGDVDLGFFGAPFRSGLVLLTRAMVEEYGVSASASSAVVSHVAARRADLFSIFPGS